MHARTLRTTALVALGFGLFAAPVYGSQATGKVDLLTEAGVKINGAQAGDFAGSSVASAGDQNGDGRPDVIIGARIADPGVPARTDAGAAYVVYGRAAPATVTLDSNGMAAADGFVIQGPNASAAAGTSVANAGDVNGDLRTDLIVGAPGTGFKGGAFVVYGQSAPSTVVLAETGLNATVGFLILAPSFFQAAGTSVGGAGDTNGDGLADVIVGSPAASPGTPARPNAGVASVVYGKATQGTLMLDNSALAASDGFVIQGALAGDRAGTAVAGVGDLNSDLRSDVIVGAPQADTASGADAGAAYVVYGMATGATVPLNTSFMFGTGFPIPGVAAGDRAGSAVSGVGDFNGDGRRDVLVGAPMADPGTPARTDAGAAYVVYGPATTVFSVGLTDTSNATETTLGGPGTSSAAGMSVAGPGDLNADGRADVLVGAPGVSSAGRSVNGNAYAVYGRTGIATTTLNGEQLPPATGFAILGATNSSDTGSSVSGAGDVNQDGRPDVLVGADLASPGTPARIQAGAAYLGDTSSVPTAVRWRGATVRAQRGRGNVVVWRTGRETENLGFDVLRLRRRTRGSVKLTRAMIHGGALGHAGPYVLRDRTGRRDDRYVIVDRGLDGVVTRHGPYGVTRGR